MTAAGTHNGERPFISVVMPIRNEAASIGCALGAVLGQNYPANRFEVLVVDGGSTDSTPDIVRRMADASSARGGPNVVLIENPRGIVPRALNLGLEAAQGDVIVRVDGHCVVAADYVERCVTSLIETNADNAGGMQDAYGLTRKERAIAAANSSPFGVPAPFRYASSAGWVDTVYLGTYRRETLEALGGFDEELIRNQDDELNQRLRQSGGRVWFDPSIRVAYRSRPTLWTLARQYLQYGAYKVRVFQKRRSLPSLRSAVPPLFVVAVVATGALAWATSLPLVAIICAYAAWVTVGALRSSSRGLVGRALVAVAITTMHLSYGIGFWYGVLRFARGFRPHG